MDPMDDIVEPAPPELLTVEEASKVMRIGRQLAYDLANDYLASGGTQGLPVIRFGVKCLRGPVGRCSSWCRPATSCACATGESRQG